MFDLEIKQINEMDITCSRWLAMLKQTKVNFESFY